MIDAATEPNLTSTVQILVVEDESVIAADIKDSLESLGYAVPAVAASGEEAIAIATAIRPDIVLMDIRLKGDMDGVQAAAQIWQQLHIPVVYSTGYSDRVTLDRAKATGPFGYVLKPIEDRELYVAIETALQRYRLDKELQEREQWLSSILRAIGDGVIVTDAHSRVKFLNLVAEGLTDWHQEEAIGKSVNEVFRIVNEKTQKPAPNPITEVLQSGKLVYLADGILLLSRGGRTIPIADSAAPFHDEQGAVAGVVLVFRDTTQRRQAEERNLVIARALQLEGQMVELQHLNQLKDDFLNTVSHELRTPLTNIRMAIRMLEITLNQHDNVTSKNNVTSRSDAPSPTLRYLRILSEQCNRQLSLVNDLLDLQRLNADAYTLELTPIQLENLIPELVDNFQERARNQQQRLEICLAPTLTPIASDMSSLERVLTELLNNAVKYTPEREKITLTAQMSDPTATGVPSVQIRICNSGVEIAADELPQIFDQFYRIPSSDRWRQGGTGLGLTLVKKLVNYLGGYLQVESRDDLTCFTVELPVYLPDFNTVASDSAS